MTTDFEMVAGDDKTLVITVTDIHGTAVDITGATVRWRASRSPNKAASIIKKTGGFGISLTDPAQGEFTVELDASDTEDLAGLFVHEGEVVFASGAISTPLQGTLKIKPALIRATAS